MERTERFALLSTSKQILFERIFRAWNGNEEIVLTDNELKGYRISQMFWFSFLAGGITLGMQAPIYALWTLLALIPAVFNQRQYENEFLMESLETMESTSEPFAEFRIGQAKFLCEVRSLHWTSKILTGLFTAPLMWPVIVFVFGYVTLPAMLKKD